MPKDRTWQWPQTAQSWDNHQKNANKSKGKGKAKESGGPSFPNYDHGVPSELSSTPSSSKDSDLKAALSAVFADRKLEVPQELQCYLQPQPGDLIQSDQKILNTKRKLLGKVDRLSKALSRKKDQWQNFRAQLKERLCKEQARYDADVQEIQLALDTTQAQLTRLMEGKELENAEMEMEEPQETPIEQMLGMDNVTQHTAATLQPMDSTAEQLRMAHAHQQQMAQQMQELQQQVLYMSQMMMPPNVQSPSALPKTGQFQGPFTPMKTRATPPLGPYSKVEDPKIETKEEKKPVDIEEISD